MLQHLKCLATVIYDLPLTTRPVSNCHLFSDINVSQGSVATRLRCGVVVMHHFAANLSLSLTMNFANPLRFDKVTAMSLLVQFFGTQCRSQYLNLLGPDVCYLS